MAFGAYTLSTSGIASGISGTFDDVVVNTYSRAYAGVAGAAGVITIVTVAPM